MATAFNCDHADTTEVQDSLGGITSDEFSTAYEEGFSRTVRFLMSRGARADGAIEAAQAAWALGWEHRNQLRNRKVVLTWINSIALNAHRQTLRKQRSLIPLVDLQAPPAPNTLLSMQVERALQLCRPQERSLLEQYMTGYSCEDIAQDLGVTNTAVRIRLLRLRRLMRRHLEGELQSEGDPIRKVA